MVPRRASNDSRTANKRPARSAGAAAIFTIALCVAPLACTESPWGGGARPFRNVLLISIDTCRPDYLSCYGYARKTTPNIDAVAAEGVLFTRAYSTNPMTLPAHSSMLTGTLPLAHGVHMNNSDRLADSNLTITEALRERGFETGAFVSAFVLDSIFGLGQGFATYGDRFANPHKAGLLLYNERSAEETSRDAMAWLEQHQEKPFFLFLHYFDPHQPYKAPPPFGREYADVPYAGEVAYTDQQIGLVIEKMKELGLYDSTLVVITSDHGQGLGDHGEETHAYFAYDSTILIPLIFRVPGGGAARVDDPVSIIDIAPTILDLAGVPRPDEMTGQSLAAGLRGQPLEKRSAPIYFESLQPQDLACAPYRGIVDGRWKLITAGEPELYDMEGEGENANLFQSEPERGRDMQEGLAALLASERPRGADLSVQLDPSVQERLRALGYLAGEQQPAAPESLSDPKECFPAYDSFGKAQALVQDRKFAAAETACVTALTARPTYLSALSLYGTIALEQRRLGDAEQRFREYLRVVAEVESAAAQPRSLDLDYGKSLVHNNLGNVFLALDRLDEAAAEYREALRLYEALPEAHQNLGTVLEANGDRAGAIEEYRNALHLDPRFIEAQKSLGDALKSAHEFDEAAVVLDDALRLDPDDPDTHLARAWVAQQRGNTPTAIEHYRRALELRPDESVCNNLAWLYATHWDESVRDPVEAVELATRAAELTEFNDVNVLDTLAAAYASAGRFPEAVETAEQALASAENASEAEVAGLNEHLRLFRRGEPFVQKAP